MDKKCIPILWMLVLTLTIGLQKLEASNSNRNDVQLFVDNLFFLTDVMVSDVANPPLAARFYSYGLMAAWLADVDNMDKKMPKFNFEFPFNSLPPDKHEIDRVFAAIYAMLEVGRELMPSGYLLEEKQNDLIYYFKKERKLRRKSLQASLEYAYEIARLVIQTASTDGYARLSTHRRYQPSRDEGRWYPTPPEYMAAIEPHWNTIRPFFLDSAHQFSPPEPACFDLDSTSNFYQQLTEVYQVTRQLSEDQNLIANFWDCNPFHVEYSGHMAIGIKKISPGGHWIGITGIACLDAGLPLHESIYIHTLVAFTLHDAFISCWTEKYISDRIRPETVINKYIDQKWRPLLQTPPFPEYTSGHSVISAASAEILTWYFGDNFAFIDTSEEYFGLPARPFSSFRQAAEEAAISRLYGGIHFRDAIEAGVVQGKAVSDFILRKSAQQPYR
ncbi:MAG: vanadium-dependent haloperoxidase [Cyclobacteriaceae bacterium]|nr:vanadium-dependent haloperoxidase [Cyclobacteriaceae bacterium]